MKTILVSAAWVLTVDEFQAERESNLAKLAEIWLFNANRWSCRGCFRNFVDQQSDLCSDCQQELKQVAEQITYYVNDGPARMISSDADFPRIPKQGYIPTRKEIAESKRPFYERLPKFRKCR